MEKCKSKINQKIEDNFISHYLILRENLSNHKNLEKSNYFEFKKNFSKLIVSSKESLDENLKKGIINFIKYLGGKLDKIYFSNNSKDIDIEIVNKKLEDLKTNIGEKIKKTKTDFENEIEDLNLKVRNKEIDEEKILEFSSKWKKQKDELNENIKNLIVKVYSEIDEFKTLKDSEYEKKKYFTKKHIIVHGVTAGAQAVGEGAGLIFSSIAISFPPIAIAIGAFALIHGGICIGKFIRDKIKKTEDLIEHLSKYKDTFIDNLNSYENDINTFLDMRKDREIGDINDRKIVGSLQLSIDERKQFLEIYNLFEKKLETYCNLE